jgi:hypothetical protein
VVAAEDDRDDSGSRYLAHRLLDLGVRPLRIGRDDRGVAEVDDAQLRERVQPGLEVRPGRTARCADRAWPEARSGPVGDEVVCRRPHDRDVDACELGRILRVRHPRVREEARVVGLVGEPELAPALERVDHL